MKREICALQIIKRCDAKHASEMNRKVKSDTATHHQGRDARHKKHAQPPPISIAAENEKF
jgi:hypothetical protein